VNRDKSMAVFSIVRHSRTAHANRCDAEFFEPRYLSLEKTLRHVCGATVSTFASASSQLFNPKPGRTFQYVEIGNVDSDTGMAKADAVEVAEAPDRAKYELTGKEILVSTVRPNRSAIAFPDQRHAGWVASSGFLPLVPVDSRVASFLFVWLKTKPITDWLERHCLASMYPAVGARDILSAPMLEPKGQLLGVVHEIVMEVRSLINDSERLYPEAEAELLEKMDWPRIANKKHGLSHAESYTSAMAAGRCDAEFFHPHYQGLRSHLVRWGAMPMRELWTRCDKGTQPSGYSDSGGVIVVKSKNVFGPGIELASCERTDASVWENVGARISEGDLVVNSTGRGTLGRAGVVPRSAEKIVASVDILICRIDCSLTAPQYVSLFLNSPPGLAQSEQFQTGSSGQLHLYPQHLAEFLVFTPPNGDGKVDLKWQRRLANKVIAANEAKAKAKTRLDDAILLLENEIEKKKR
jgi:hypothetical protein